MDTRTPPLPVPALAVTVEIGADDIEQGHMAKCRSCPTALAANRATGRFCDAGGFHLIAYDNAQYMENENLLVGLLPEAAKGVDRPVRCPAGRLGGRPARADALPAGAVPDRRLRAAGFAPTTCAPCSPRRRKPAWPSPSSGRCTPTRQRSSSPDATAISRGPWAAGTAPPPVSTKSTGRPLAPGPTTCPTAPAISSACRPSTAPAERPTGETPTGSPGRRRPLHPRENTHDPPDAN